MQNEDREKTVGKIKESIGWITDDRKLEAEGRLQQARAAMREIRAKQKRVRILLHPKEIFKQN
ncbi:MAG: CsbD family protein [Candidatus Omnitrophica bacterium]|nr:CsbD family protein [Candidatus Omnitrophota bacterium]